MHSIFDQKAVDDFVARIETLKPDTRAKWGKMDAAQMLAHNSLIFESARNDTYPTMNPILRWIVSRMIRSMVIGDKPYMKKARTAPAWAVSDPKDLEKEKTRMRENLQAVHDLGAGHFEGKSNPTFGTLTSAEWSRLFLKHLDYHLEQFGA